MESGIDQERFELWKSFEIGGIHRVHLCLRLLNGGAGPQACDL